MKNYTNGPEIPMGLGMALAKDINAMNYFSSLPKEKQEQVINHTHQIKSSQEMQSYVQSLMDSNNLT